MLLVVLIPTLLLVLALLFIAARALEDYHSPARANPRLLRARVTYEVPYISGDTPPRPGTPEGTGRVAELIYTHVARQLDSLEQGPA